MNSNIVVIVYAHDTLMKELFSSEKRSGELLLLSVYDHNGQLDADLMQKEYETLFPAKLSMSKATYLRFLNKEMLLGFITKFIKNGDQREYIMLDSATFNAALIQSDKLSQFWDNLLKTGEKITPVQGEKGLWDRLF